jgi:outer membrane protein OmpA-like peptidoglycan-associated protein
LANLSGTLTPPPAPKKQRNVREHEDSGHSGRGRHGREHQKAGDMHRRVKSVLAGAFVGIGLMSSLLIAPGYAQDDKAQGANGQVATGQKIETKGLILTRDGENMTVETRDMGTVVVTLTPETKIKVPKGLFRHEEMEVTYLIPGVEVEVKGKGSANGQVVADNVEFTKDSWGRAKQAHAAMTANTAQTEANKQGVAKAHEGIAANQAQLGTHAEKIGAVEKKFADLTEYDVKKDISINFETGKSELSDEGKTQLTELANDAKGLKGYLVEVKGFASASGNAERNQTLSDERSENVEAFLQQQGIALQHIVNTGAMGTTEPVAANDTEAGRQQNQRVEVKILVNRGVGGPK